MEKIVLFLGIVFMLSSTNISLAATMSPKDCETMASAVNATTPKRVDEFTELKTTYCLTFSGQIEYKYVYEILGQLQVNKIPEDFKTNVKNSFCTGPDTSYLIGLLDKVTYEYYYKDNGKYFDRFSFSKRDC